MSLADRWRLYREVRRADREFLQRQEERDLDPAPIEINYEPWWEHPITVTLGPDEVRRIRDDLGRAQMRVPTVDSATTAVVGTLSDIEHEQAIDRLVRAMTGTTPLTTKESTMQYEPRILRSDDSEQEFSGGVTLRIPAAWHVIAGEYANEGTPDLLVTVVHAIDGDGNDVRAEVALKIREALAPPPEPVKQRGSLPTVLLVASSVAAANAFLMAERDAPPLQGVNARVITPETVEAIRGSSLGADDHVVFVPGWEAAFISATAPDEETPWHLLTQALAHAFHSIPTWRQQIVQVP